MKVAGKWSNQDVLKQLEYFPGWTMRCHAEEMSELTKQFVFQHFAHTQSAIIALMQLAEQQNHHPEVHFTYSHVTVVWNTHSAGGITHNDWVCASLTEHQFNFIQKAV